MGLPRLVFFPYLLASWQDPGVRTRLLSHCKEEGCPVTPLLLETLANLARAEDGREEVLHLHLPPAPAH